MHACRDPQPLRRQLYLERVHWVLQKYVKQLGLGHGDSAHAMRATFITTALENGAKLADVQRTVGHADPATTQLYDRGAVYAAEIGSVSGSILSGSGDPHGA
jgi:site-specific recombinase XerD